MRFLTYPHAFNHVIKLAIATLIFALISTLIGVVPAESAEPETQEPATVQSKEKEIEVVADDLQYIKEERKILATGNVVVVQGDIELSADQAEVQIDTKEAQARGHVFVRQRDKGVLTGDEVNFNFDESKGSFPNGRFYHFPWYGKGEQLDQVRENVIKAQNVFITSCNLPSPHYDLKASSATVYPGDKIVAKNVVFRILQVPVFWWPYLVIPLNYPLGNLTTGYTDEWGGYIKAAKGFAITENVKGRLLFDWYSKRGFGFGAEVDYKFDRLGTGEFKIYGIRDDDSPDQREDNPFAEENRIDQDRGRISWKHKARIDAYTTVQTQWHELSDDQFLQDFFEREHRAEIDPRSYVTLTRNAPKYSLLTHFEKRTNRFQSVDEKLPEIIFTWLRKPLFGTNFYYTNQEGFLNHTETASFRPRVRNTLQFFTDHELSYPMRFFRFYNFIPFLNLRQDVYTEGRTKEEKISRYALGLGFDSSTRYYKTWDWEGDFLGIEFNGVRHVLEPIIQYNAIKLASVEPTRLINTGRGDDIDHQDIVTFGVENRIQTKRKDGDAESRVDVVSFNTFLDLSFGPGSDLLETRSNKFVEARIETEFRPYDWLLFRDEISYDFNDHKLTRNNLDLQLYNGPIEFRVSHRLENTSSDSENSQLTVDADYKLNERWKIGGYLRWESFDNIVEEWEIRARRDLHDWILDFGLNVRNTERDAEREDSGRELNKEIFVELQLKAVEQIELKSGHRASFSSPRIGRRVSGANEAPDQSFLGPSSDISHVSLATS